jgi:hypothetical protein
VTDEEQTASAEAGRAISIIYEGFDADEDGRARLAARMASARAQQSARWTAPAEPGLGIARSIRASSYHRADPQEAGRGGRGRRPVAAVGVGVVIGLIVGIGLSAGRKQALARSSCEPGAASVPHPSDEARTAGASRSPAIERDHAPRGGGASIARSSAGVSRQRLAAARPSIRTNSASLAISRRP